MILAKKIYFASDFHFGIPDRNSSLRREEKFVRWLDRVKADAEEIFLMGDLFDFWFEYKTVVPKGYVRLLGKLAEISDAGIPLHFFRGNHDMWAFDYLEKEVGIKLYRQPVIREFAGKKFFLAHGDALGRGDNGYKLIKYIFERKINRFLFRWIHPDIGVRLGLFWSGRSRYANIIKEEKEARESIQPDFQKSRLAGFCRDYLHSGEHIDYFIFGHWHVANIEPLENGSFYIHLGDWLTRYTYGIFDGEKFELKKFEE
ncbi:MAG TPA: UDP-2,3-diacylglucosamine diphosphatase [Bacteroidales bacterium]|nr:UDP-2,3-diacylglucosamine diphosphatase [Bacteroidales bacterium]